MPRQRSTHYFVLLYALAAPLVASPGSVFSMEQQERSLDCGDRWSNGRLATHCEIREQTIGTIRETLTVDGRINGGISIKGWDRNGILIRAQVQSAALSDAEAVELARYIQILTDGARIRAEGPPHSSQRNWSVSYEIFVPRQSHLSLTTHNGGISVSDIQGRLEFTALNGGVSLRRLAGSVTGTTTNGGLTIDLAGNQWQGEGLDVRTTNGAVTLLIPEHYSALLETGTVNGGLRVGFPVMVEGELNKGISAKLGYGGPRIRATTTNGGVRVMRKV